MPSSLPLAAPYVRGSSALAAYSMERAPPTSNEAIDESTTLPYAAALAEPPMRSAR